MMKWFYLFLLLLINIRSAMVQISDLDELTPPKLRHKLAESNKDTIIVKFQLYNYGRICLICSDMDVLIC